MLAKGLDMERCSESQSPLLCSFARTRLPSALQVDPQRARCAKNLTTF
jgi:hypothetical protein